MNDPEKNVGLFYKMKTLDSKCLVHGWKALDMVDKFGTYAGEKAGPVGPKGPPGESLSSLFFSKNLSKWFEDILSFSCYFKTPSSGLEFDYDDKIKKKKAIGIKNQIKNRKYASALNDVESLTEIPEYGYGLTFSKSVYMFEDMDWALGENSKAILMFAFKVDAWPEHVEHIFSRKYKDRGIFLKGAHLHIRSSKSEYVKVEYLQKDWNICYLEFNNHRLTDRQKSYYKINDKEGQFTLEDGKDPKDIQMFLGGEISVRYFQGAIARVDFVALTIATKLEENLPKSVRDSVLKEQYEDLIQT